MARLVERVFDPSKPLFVRRFFAGAGRHWNPGDEFPWRRLAIDARRVRLLFDSGKLMHAATAEPAFAPLIEVGAVGAVLTPAPSIAQETEDEDIHHIAVTAAPADEQPAAPEQVTGETDGLDDLKMKDLRAIAAAEGAPVRLRRNEQIDAIRENRLSKA
jgi:hypothetical protein